MSGTPTNSAIFKQLRRLKHIVSLLKRGDMSAQEILRDLEMNSHDEAHRMTCSTRTLRRDVAILRSEYGCPIRYRVSEHVYHLENCNWNFPGLLPSTVNREEVLALVLGAKFARDILPPSISRGVERTVDEILSRNSSDGEYLSRQRIKSLKILVNAGPISEVVFHRVFEAWRNSRRLTIDYIDAKDVRKQYEIEPQALVFYDMQWGMKAFCPADQKWRVFLLGRIYQTYETGQTFKPCEQQIRDITADNYFQFPDPVEVVLRLTNAGKQFAMAHPLRATQRITEEGAGHFILRASSVSVPETLRWIFMQTSAGDALPLEPSALVDAFRKRLNELKKQLDAQFPSS